MILTFTWQHRAGAGLRLANFAILMVKYQQRKQADVSSLPEEKHDQFNMGNVQNRLVVMVERTTNVFYLMARTS